MLIFLLIGWEERTYLINSCLNDNRCGLLEMHLLITKDYDCIELDSSEEDVKSDLLVSFLIWRCPVSPSYLYY